MALTILWLSMVVVGCVASVDVGRDYGAPYEPYDPNSVPYGPPDKWPLPSPSFSPQALITTQGCGGTVMKVLVAIVAGLALLKLPLVLLFKGLLVKLALPLGVAAALAPLALPFAYLLLSRNSKDKDKDEMAQDQPQGRALASFLESEECLEAIACRIASTQDTDSQKTVTWILRRAGGLMSDDWRKESRLPSYSEAYLGGAAKGPKYCQRYACKSPQLFIKRGTETLPLL